MPNIGGMIVCLDRHMEQNQKDSLTAKEAAKVLEEAGLLSDAKTCAGLPLRKLLRKGEFTHAYQVAGPGSEWVIPRSTNGSDLRDHQAPARKSSSIRFAKSHDDESDQDAYELARMKYRPAKVKILLVGESRPAGRSFFYHANSNLYRHTREVFEEVYNLEFESGEQFLEFLREHGFYLDDLCIDPVNYMGGRERKTACLAAVPSLAKRIKSYAPNAVVCLLKGIEANVREAVIHSGSNLSLGFHSLHFPSRPNWAKLYRAELVDVLKKNRVHAK